MNTPICFPSPPSLNHDFLLSQDDVGHESILTVSSSRLTHMKQQLPHITILVQESNLQVVLCRHSSDHTRLNLLFLRLLSPSNLRRCSHGRPVPCQAAWFYLWSLKSKLNCERWDLSCEVLRVRGEVWGLSSRCEGWDLMCEVKGNFHGLVCEYQVITNLSCGLYRRQR